MSEVIEQTAVQRLPLDEKHRQHGASMSERDGWLLPASYGDVAAEYRAVREGGAGLVDLSSRACINVSGAEAVQFLNGLITNDVKTLAPGRSMAAAFPNVQGRLLASVRVIHQDDKFLIDTEATTYERVFKSLERFTLAGDFKVEDITNETVILSLQGMRASEVLSAVTGIDASQLERGQAVTASWPDKRLLVVRATHTGENGFDLFTGANDAPALWDALMAAGARPVGYEALEILRIELGQPRYNVDMSDANVVLESGLDHAVSFTKGCYIGQEIIARIHWRGHVAKKLVGLSFEEAVDVARDAIIKTTDDKEIGRVTSATFSPRLNRNIALGYVKYAYLAPGTLVRVAVGDAESTARVLELPFVRGSWFETVSETEEPKV